MPLPPLPRRASLLASLLTAAGVVLAAASCSHIAPLSPHPDAPVPPQYHLKSPIILQAMRSQPPTATGGCPSGWVPVVPGAAPTGCYSPLGPPVTLTSAGLTSVTPSRPTPVPGQPPQPTQYGFIIAVPAADVAAVSALLMQVYDSKGAFGISVAGELWEAPQVAKPFPGRQLQIALLSRSRALQLYRLLVLSG